MGHTKRPNNQLKHARELKGWAQEDVAKRIGTTVKIVSRWECGDCQPLPYYRKKLCALFGKNAEELGFVAPQEEPTAPTLSPPSPSWQEVSGPPHTRSFWALPHQRNPLFTGREALLQHLHQLLNADHAVALAHPGRPPHAISGLGGIGKTQTALEYAYRHHDQYETVLWVKADTRENLMADFLAIAMRLRLVEKDEQEPYYAVNAVKQWLKDHTRWLLILDNADDLSVVHDFLPPLGAGHTLLTSRASAVARLARRVEIGTMASDEGTLFLLRRAGMLGPYDRLEDAPPKERVCAAKIVEVMEGLPLALDQAGAYIEETGISTADYLDLYQMHRTVLLRRRGTVSSEYPHTVATVWSLSLQQVEQADPAAAELLHWCAFLDPDAIPEEMITAAAPVLGPLLAAMASDQLRLNEAMEVLLRFSLMRRNAQSKTLSIHRLVQAVIQDAMDPETARSWAERTIHAVDRAFPSRVEATVWQRCQRCLPHVQCSATWMDRYTLRSAEGAHLFNQAGYYLKEQSLCAEAESFYRRALSIREQVFGPAHLETAQSLYNLARLHYDQGNYAEGEQLHLRALAIREQVLGPEHPDVAQSLNSLALLYWAWGKYAEAEPLYQRALPIRERMLGPEHPETAHCLNNIALLYVSLGKYAEAEDLHKRVLAIREQVLPADHPDTAQSLQNLAGLYVARGEQSKYSEAEHLYRRSLSIREQILGLEHLQTAKSLHNLAMLYEAQGKYTEAEPLYQRILAIREKALGADNPKTLATVASYGALLRKMKRDEEAASLEARVKAVQA